MELRDYLHFNRMSITQLSKEIDCSRHYLSNIVNGGIIPGKRLAKEIVQATKGEVTLEDLRPQKNMEIPV